MLDRSRLFLVMGLLLGSASAQGQGSEISLRTDQYKPITFEDIAPTQYSNEGDTLVATVKSSASVLLLPFDAIRKVKKVSFQWKGEGPEGVKDQALEGSKKGDDAALRIGLMVSGEARSVPFFAPAWIKMVSKVLKLPSSQLIYLIPGAKHKAGTSWPSPYSDSIVNQSLVSEPGADGWKSASFEPPAALDLVGLWIMADGDNTKSSFVTQVRSLRLD